VELDSQVAFAGCAVHGIGSLIRGVLCSHIEREEKTGTYEDGWNAGRDAAVELIGSVFHSVDAAKLARVESGLWLNAASQSNILAELRALVPIADKPDSR
jgi:hypothetical protein